MTVPEDAATSLTSLTGMESKLYALGALKTLIKPVSNNLNNHKTDVIHGRVRPQYPRVIIAPPSILSEHF